jgi:hypothetical protein
MIGVTDTGLYRNIVFRIVQPLGEEKMEHKMFLGQSELSVPRIGVGAMTWGDAKGWHAFTLPRPPTAVRKASRKKSAHWK